jgi:hypothetical protein
VSTKEIFILFFEIVAREKLNSILESFRSPSDQVHSNEMPDNSMDMDVDSSSLENMSSQSRIESNPAGECVPFDEPHEWCRLSYYELARRVGEQYRVTRSQVIIDGFLSPSDAERFCLGSLPNVDRTPDIDLTRRYIGRGVKLYHIRGNVFAECLSDNAVFVQSPIANRRQGWHPATVCKIEPSTNIAMSHNMSSYVTKHM